MSQSNELLNLLNSSGFIFQIGVQNEIERTFTNHYWKILDWEYRWEHSEQRQSRFIDLIIRHSLSSWTMVIECKRATRRNWVFLIPKGYSSSSKRITTFWTLSSNNSQGDYTWVPAEADPESPESAFCIVQGQEDGKTPMLERIADVLLLSTEVLAMEDLSQRKDVPLYHFYFPIIVTNAILYTCSFTPEDVSMTDGKLPEGKGEFKTVDMVRFRKTLAKGSEPSKDLGTSGYIKSLKEQTVLVINAESLPKILEQFKLSSESGEHIKGYILSKKRKGK